MKKVMYFEIPADDMERAKKFYSIFDWQIEDWPMADGSVHVGARTTEVDEKTYIPLEPGAINGSIVERDQFSKTPSVMVNVPSIDEYIKKVETAGGKLLKPRTDVEGMGFYAYVQDTEGNTLGLWEDVKKS